MRWITGSRLRLLRSNQKLLIAPTKSPLVFTVRYLSICSSVQTNSPTFFARKEEDNGKGIRVNIMENCCRVLAHN